MNEQKIAAILFDMDGVLVDAKEWHYEALNRSLALFGYEISRYDHVMTFDGLPTRKKLELLSKERGLPVALHSFISELKQKYTTEIIHTQCRPNFRHERALSHLKKKGYALAVCSNSVRASIALMMEKAGLSSYLKFMLSNEDVSKAKPDPEIYLTAIRRLELNPQCCLIVEDNPHGIDAARASGAHVLEVASSDEVSLERIEARIAQIEGDLKC